MTDLTDREQDRLRQALTCIALEADSAVAHRRSRPALGWVAAAVAAAAVGVAAVTVVQHEDSPATSAGPVADVPSPSVSTTATAPATIQQGVGIGSSVSYDLDRLLRESPRVVIGTVREIRHGNGDQAGGLPYVLARVQVTEALRGSSSDVWAFDYDLGAGTSISSAPAGAPWKVGQSLLLFLAPSTGTVHEALDPAHEQVVGGAQGRYDVVDGRLSSAPFTLDQVRAQAR